MRWPFNRKKQPESDKTREILARNLEAGMIAYPMGEGRVTPAQVVAIGEELGVTFPDAFIAHVCGEFPGIYVEVKSEIWPEAKEHDVRLFWAFLKGFHTFSPLLSSENWMRLDHRAKELQEQTALQIAPVLKRVSDPNLICVDAKGMLYELDFYERALTPLDADFWTVLDQEWRELAARKNRFLLEYSDKKVRS